MLYDPGSKWYTVHKKYDILRAIHIYKESQAQMKIKVFQNKKSFWFTFIFLLYPHTSNYYTTT